MKVMTGRGRRGRAGRPGRHHRQHPRPLSLLGPAAVPRQTRRALTSGPTNLILMTEKFTIECFSKIQ